MSELSEIRWFFRTLYFIRTRAVGAKIVYALFPFVVVGIAAARFGIVKPEVGFAIERFVISLGFLGLLVAIGWREVKKYRRDRYAEALEDIHFIQHTLRDQLVALDEFELTGSTEFDRQAEIVQENLQKCLHRFGEIFSKLTGVKCRASIKMWETVEIDGKLEASVYTFMRDYGSSGSQFSNDIMRRHDGKDLLSKNADFKKVYLREQQFFFSNDLLSDEDYRNSRDETLPRVQPAWWMFWSKANWELPYRASIVWPIRWQNPRVSTAKATDVHTPAFLTIDTDKVGVFDKDFDSQLGAIMADSLYYMLIRLEDIVPEGDQDA